MCSVILGVRLNNAGMTKGAPSGASDAMTKKGAICCCHNWIISHLCLKAKREIDVFRQEATEGICRNRWS